MTVCILSFAGKRILVPYVSLFQYGQDELAVKNKIVVIRSLRQLFSFLFVLSFLDCTLGLGIKHGQSERTKDC